MMSSNDADPFLEVQQDVLSQLNTTRSLFSSYLRIRSLTTTASSPELASARSDLETALGDLADDLEDLVDSVQAIESDPSQFGISKEEVKRRQRLVQDVGGHIDEMREEMRKKILGPGTAAAAGSDLPDPSAYAIPEGADDDPYAEFEQQQQVEIMREQDQHLDGVFRTVGNLRQQADTMGRELEEQREMLEVVEEATDRVAGRLQNGMQKLQHVMRKNEDRFSGCCIAVLIFVLILLLILILVL
ncbi:unnamed protein product [Clonostachys rosea f. rosea IK726]|uniref:t-SNARE affecting a late Golgi compartment protein 1 n=3 Tax=Clonostachys TaxID=110564 RepID=A0A0B7KEV9_BIOOC|nr:unnamed protein product [Clonostachys rosea f. rosea IK726]CAH0029251.1 unnamed protein product [Clonostachys rhizophaga]